MTNDQKQPLETNELVGLGGWLVLVGFSIFISPFRIGAFLYQAYQEIFVSGVWHLLTAVDTPTYLPNFGQLLIIELAVNIGLILAILYLGTLHANFCKSQKHFCKLGNIAALPD